MGASPPTNVWDGEKSTRPDLNVKLPESSISATRVLVRSFALAKLGAHVSPIFFEVAKSLTSVSTNQTVSPEARPPRWSGSVTTSRTRSTWPDVRNCFVIFLSAAGLAAKLRWGAENDATKIIIEPQIHLPSFFLGFMALPFFCNQSGFTHATSKRALPSAPSLLQSGIALHIDPVSRLGRDVAA